MRHPRRLARRGSRNAELATEFPDNNDCTNALFLAANQILSVDQNDGVFPGRFSSPEHVARTWESLRGCSTFLTKGEKIKAARWFQFNRRTRDVLSTALSLLLMITYIAMLDRWFDYVDTSPLGQLLGRGKPPDDTAAAGDENEEDGRGRQELSVRSLLVVQSHRVACSFRIGTWSSSVVRARKHTPSHVAGILSCRSTRAMTVVIVDVSLPCEVEAGNTC